MRIAHVTATFPPYWGGTGNVCYYNARELSRQGHEMHVFTASVQGAPAEENIQGVFVHRLKPLFQFGNAPFLPGLVKLKGFDIIHLHYPFFGGELTAIAACFQKTPLVITYHQDVHLSGILRIIERLLRSTTSRWVLRSAEQILFTSLDYSQSSYARQLLHGQESQIGELPNGVDPQHFWPGNPSILLAEKYRSSDNDKIVLLVASLDKAHYFKGVTNLLQALIRLPDTIKAVVVGGGNMKSEYETLTRTLKLENRVFFPGRVQNEILPQYYQMADVTVLPSISMGEAFGLVLVESLACETPVIASNLPGVRTVVADGIDGFLVKPNDVTDLAEKISLMLNLPEEESRAMGERGREKVLEKYTWEHAGERLEIIYHEIINCNDT
jgi:glycosyltransferase involved in cell wall biosynthesis